MPKIKTNTGAKKRFALTGTGKIKRKHAYHSHILTKKTKKQKRNLDHFAIVDKSNVKQVKEPQLTLPLAPTKTNNNAKISKPRSITRKT